MKKIGEPNDQTSIPRRGVVSVKIASVLLVGILIIGNIPTTHSFPGSKGDIASIWLAAKEFWESLRLFNNNEELENEVLVVDQNKKEIQAGESDILPEYLDTNLQNLKNSPECKSIYVSEYLPTFNTLAIDKCEKVLEQNKQQRLFDTYVEHLCMDPGDSMLNRKQLGEVQLRLRKYALTFPQSNIQVSLSDIDGLYGPKSCQVIANYQNLSKFDMVDGVPDQQLYESLVAVIPLSESELTQLSWKQSVKPQSEPQLANLLQVESTVELPNNPFKRIVFCWKNPHINGCGRKDESFDIAKVELSRR